jgi:hypothetical protein
MSDEYNIPEFMSKIADYESTYMNYQIKNDNSFHFDNYKAFARRNQMETISC